MRRELIIKSRSLAGTSDLTLLAPIKKGLVPSLESVTYKTRIKRLLQALNTGRSSSQEFALLRPFADAIERIGRIHSVRVTVLEPEDKVLLAVSFDGTWEAYIRVLWQKVGPLMDIIFFDTEGYASAYDCRFEEWEAWAHRVQVETDFYYGTPNLSVDDVQYLRRTEAIHASCPARSDADLVATRLTVDSAEAIAWRAAAKTSGQASLEAVKQGLEALAALYRLTDLYLPTGEDGQFLQRAVRDLLREFVVLIEKDEVPAEVLALAHLRFDKQIQWVKQALVPPRNPQRVAPPLPTAYPDFDEADVQGGIVGGYTGVTHGCLMLLAIADRAKAVAFFERLVGQVRPEKAGAQLARGEPAVNASLTYEGLRAAGLSEAELALFPQEFREGMEARASILGDLRTNHPRRWSLPVRHGASGNPPPRVEWSAVHLVVQLRIGTDKTDEWLGDVSAAAHPLSAAFAEWRQAAADAGLDLLAVEPLQRFYKGTTGDQVEEHFGFADGNSDPTIDPASAGAVYPNQIHLGELLVGHANEADWPSDPERRRDPALERLRMTWLRNGSFLVVRKLAQDRPRLNQIVDDAVAQTGLEHETVRAKMMGRQSDGTPLVPPTAAALHGNDYDYSGDPDGRFCPIHAHIRRANPRIQTLEVNEAPGRRTPRIARRGMSYGPRFDPGKADTAAADRGMVFMAYNARIGEQFEVIQRWISGGNSSRGYSGHSDPLLGVPENGRQRTFRFEHGQPVPPATAPVACIALDGSNDALGERAPIVRLQWGAYLFTPSIATLRRLRDRVAQHAAPPEAPWSAQDGEQRIQDLLVRCAGLAADQAIETVKTALEDPVEQEKFRSASIWAAIREHHAGVLRTPYGVLVADGDLIGQVLADGAGYSVRGYHDRLASSIGDIYLGHDPGDDYDYLSTGTNQAIQAITKGQAFDLTREITQGVLDTFLLRAQLLPNPSEPDRWELMLEIKEVVDQVLGQLCQYWFGLPAQDTDELRLSGFRWDAGTTQALYPGHFTAPSRYCFQPRPGASVEELGRDHGRTLTSAFSRFVARTVAAGDWPLKDPQGHVAPVAEAIWLAFGGATPQVDLIARTMVGAMMGMLPTVDGSLRRALNEWLYEGRFWSLRAAWTAIPKAQRDFTAAVDGLEPALLAAMQLRPSPELIWRTATRPGWIGPEVVQPGDRIVLALVSATQAELAAGGSDVYPIFGGDRSAASAPTHACPGYGAAIGVLLGFIAALFDVPEAMRPAPVALALTFDGPFDVAGQAAQAARFGPVFEAMAAEQAASAKDQQALAAKRRGQLAGLTGDQPTTGGA